MKLFICTAILLLCLTGCDEHNGVVFKGRDGQFYRLEHYVGSNYRIAKIDTTGIGRLMQPDSIQK